MGTSRPYYLSEMCNYIVQTQPKTILDIGIGFGKNGFLCREYTDIWNGNYNKKDWRTKIHGIEIFKEYLGEHQNYIYNEIFIGDAFNIIDSLDNYDLIIATDIIEHFERSHAENMIEKIKAKSKKFIITIPIHVGNRGGVQPVGLSYNKYEAHISGEWQEDELKKFGNVKKFDSHTWYLES